MINIAADRERRVVIVELKGHIGVAEAKDAVDRLERVIPARARGYTALFDFSSIGDMDVGFEDEVKRSMKLLGSRDVRRVVRVLPGPDAEVSFDMLSRRYYPGDVEIRTFFSRAEADAALGLARRP